MTESIGIQLRIRCIDAECHAFWNVIQTEQNIKIFHQTDPRCILAIIHISNVIYTSILILCRSSLAILFYIFLVIYGLMSIYGYFKWWLLIHCRHFLVAHPGVVSIWWNCQPRGYTATSWPNAGPPNFVEYGREFAMRVCLSVYLSKATVDASFLQTNESFYFTFVMWGKGTVVERS